MGVIAILARIITFAINSSWFFYLIVLVFLGGVIILIIYISTLSANEKFRDFRLNVTELRAAAAISSLTLFGIKIKYRSPVINMRNIAIGISYESSNFSLLVFLILYLLITLVCVVKLVKFESGPLIKRL